MVKGNKQKKFESPNAAAPRPTPFQNRKSPNAFPAFRSGGCGNAPETMEHIFWSCPLVRDVWTIALRTLDRLSGTVFNKLQHAAAWKTTHFLRVLLTDSPYCAVARPAAPAEWRCLIWRFLRAEALWSIWLHRCAARKIGDRVPVSYTTADIARTWQCAVRKRVLEEPRFLPTLSSSVLTAGLRMGRLRS